MASFNRVTDVHPGPNRYITEPGSVKNLNKYIEDYENPVIVTGELSAQAFLDYTGAEEFFAPALRYDRSATERNAKELAEQAKALNADAIIAIGAGKLADTAKNVADLLGVDLIMVPTLACACAAYTPFSVNYDDQHRYVGSPLHGRNSVAMIVDSAMISQAPAEKMVGGIGDTIAKWYECAPVLERANDLSAFDQLAYQSAHLILDILLEHSEPALEALRNGDYDNEHIGILIDTNIGLAGTVGGLGCERARVSGAHAVHNALTQIHGSDATMHGDKVAYGVLVQLVAEGKEDEARRLLPFYDSVGLPHSWKQMNLEFTDENLRTVADYTADPETSTFMAAVPDATSDMIVEAMRIVEAM